MTKMDSLDKQIKELLSDIWEDAQLLVLEQMGYTDYINENKKRIYKLLRDESKCKTCADWGQSLNIPIIENLKEENRILKESQEGLNIIRDIAHEYKDKSEKYEKALKDIMLKLHNAIRLRRLNDNTDLELITYDIQKALEDI